jgi:hypothetical protein
MPVWNSPKGGTGLTISGDYGKPSDDAGGGSAFGARAALGFSRLTVSAGLSSYEPEGASERITSYGATLAIRLIGGALLPVNVNIIGGAATTSDVSLGLTTGDLTTIVAGGGVSVTLPVPGFSIEPYLSVTNRWNRVSALGTSDTESDIGWTLGANVGLGMFGLHAAYDSQDRFGTAGTAGVLGVGAHIGLTIPGL